MIYPSHQDLLTKGVLLQPKTKWLREDLRLRLAKDAKLTTTPNMSIPSQFLTYLSPDVIKILTSPENARAVLKEKQMGDWTTHTTEFRLQEYTGTTGPYQDYGNGPTSDVNNEWQTRQQYVFETSISYGDREVDMSAKAKIDMLEDKQRAAAHIISHDANRFYLLGVKDKKIYGLLNDPNLPPAISPIPVTVSGKTVTKWSDKLALGERGAVDVFNDVRTLFARLQSQTNGLINETTSMKLLISPTRSSDLRAANSFGKMATELIDNAFPNIEKITIPELSTESGESIMLVVPSLLGMDVAELGYGLKLKQGRLIADMSSYKQKFSASTYGCIIKIPAAFAMMNGI